GQVNLGQRGNGKQSEGQRSRQQQRQRQQRRSNRPSYEGTRYAHQSPAAGSSTVRNPKRSNRVASRSNHRYTTGVVYRVSAWLTRRPPTMVIPRGWRSSEPVPEPRARGKPPSRAAMVVIMMGRKRSRQA